MIAACVRAGVQLGVIFQQRTMSVYQKAKELLHANAVLLSADRQTTVRLPLDRSAYATFLEEKRR